MTSKPAIVTFERDISSVTDRDASRVHALLKQGCHGVTQRDVTYRSVTSERDIRCVTGPASNAVPAHIGASRARMFSDRCTGCQVGQGRNCACRDAAPVRRSRWSPAVNVLLILGLFAAVKLKLAFAAVVLAGLLGYAAWRVLA